MKATKHFEEIKWKKKKKKSISYMLKLKQTRKKEKWVRRLTIFKAEIAAK